MKQQDLSTQGFILVEAAVGTVLFAFLLMLILHGIGFLVQRTACVAQRNAALCAATLKMQKSESISECVVPVTYVHSSVVWHSVCIQSGDQTVLLYGAGKRI